MLNALLKRYNHFRKEKYFQAPLFHARKKYAFVGFGIHSMTVFYSLLRYFNVPLKYICTKSTDWKEKLSPLFPGCTFTHDLDAIINDPEIAGVFVCTSPEAHYDILTKLLKAGKPVFVEKPPCQTLIQLHDLHRIDPSAICIVGLQRRYWPGNDRIIKKCRSVRNYIYQFQTGPLAEGDPITELFIHPLDYARFLFGDPKSMSVSKHQDDKGITFQLHLKHSNGCSGLVHLSTHSSWNPPLECLTFNTNNETFTLQYPASVTGKKLPFRPMNIPTERLMNQSPTLKEYYNGAPTLTPALETNTLHVQGFLSEIERFVTLVEATPAAGSVTTRTREGQDDANDLPSLFSIYELFEALR
jgi:virulence factor